MARSTSTAIWLRIAVSSGVLRSRVADEVAEPRLLVFADRRFERRRRLRGLEEQLHLADRQLHARGELLGRRFPIELGRERAPLAGEPVERFDDVHGRRMVRP